MKKLILAIFMAAVLPVAAQTGAYRLPQQEKRKKLVWI
jgi:hypothetical protein